MAAGTYFGKYFLLKRLAQGGMGEIYIAKQQGPGGFSKTVALKKVLPHLSENKEFIAGFLSEAALSAKMSHRNIVNVFDFGLDEESNSYFLTMEYIAGKPLNNVLETCVQRKERMPLALIRDIAIQMSDGMSYAHNLADDLGQQLNLVHRDLNPANLLVSYGGDVKIIDWGIAKSEMSQVKTEAGMIKGKFVYMSPEQSMAKKLDKRSDIFAAGITLYEMLTGENPFHKPNVVLSLEAIQRLDPPPPSEFDPALAGFDPIVAKALAKDREKRYQDCSEMSEDLKSVVVPPSSEKLGQFVGRLFRSSLEEEQKLMQETGAARLPPRQQQSNPGARIPQFSAADEERGGTLVIGPDSGVSQEELRRQMDTARRKLMAQQQAQQLARSQASSEPPSGGDAPQRTMFIGAADLQPPPKKSNGLLIGGIAAGVLVGIAGVVAFFLLNSKPSESPPPVAALPPPTAVVAAPVEAPKPVEPPKPAEAPKPMEAPKPLEAARPADRPKVAEPVKPADAPKPVEAAKPIEATKPAETVVVAKVAPPPTPSAASRGALRLLPFPPMPVSLNNRELSSKDIKLSSDLGVFQIGDDGSPLRITLTYRLDGDSLKAEIDSEPWSIVSVNDNAKGKVPQKVDIGADIVKIEFKRPGAEGTPPKLMLKYTKD
jgi:serine/threonine protein kinase